MAGGNEQVILCERGIRTYETYTRNTLDISAVPILKKLSHLPVVVDPSHASGIAWLVEPLAMAAVAAGADGLIIEVHNNPAKALSDGAQSLTPDQFDRVAQRVLRTKDAPLQIERIIPSEGRPAKEDFPGRQAGGLAGQRSYPLLVNLDGASNFCYTNAVQHRTTAAKAPFASCSWSFSRAGKRRFCGKRRMDS